MIAITPAFCMTLRGWPCMWNCVRPIGRQFASGFSLLLSAIRCFFKSAAHGVSGSPSGMFVPRSPNVATGGVPGGGGGGGVAFAPRPLPRPSPCARVHSPDKSGLPSAVRGTDASMLTCPFGSFGTAGFARFSHCAPAPGARIASTAKPVNSLRPVFMRMLYHEDAKDTKQIFVQGLDVQLTGPELDDHGRVGVVVAVSDPGGLNPDVDQAGPGQAAGPIGIDRVVDLLQP